jgi:ribosomal protein S18 acetylase RimI-like enzyme
MRIRNYRLGDIPSLVHIQQAAAQVDGTEPLSEQDFEAWFAQAELEPEHNVFVITDDDESNEWGQAGTLEGVEGEIVGYSVVQLRRSEHAYHFLCEGAVHPQQRGRSAGWSLLISALNRVRISALEVAFEAEQQGYPIYFEALLPVHEMVAENLAAKCELAPTDERTPERTRLYRRELEL